MFKAGVGQEKITPPVGTLLAGYASNRPAVGVFDDLEVTAIYIGDDNTNALLISATVLNIGNEVVLQLQDEIKAKYDVENVIICATHTHSGPIMKTTAGWGNADEEYLNNIFIPQTLEAVSTAIKSQKEALIGIGCTESEVGINRRGIKEDGSVTLGGRAWGILDKKMYVLAFKTLDGTPICNLVHYGAHGTVAPGPADNSLITRDWSGVMTDRLKDFTKAPSVFFNAAEGDVAPRMIYNSDDRLSQVRELGSKAAFDALDAFKNIKEYKSPSICVMKDEVKLPYDEIPTLEEAQKALDDMGDGVMGVLELEQARYKEIIELHKSNVEKKTHFTFNQTVIAIGEIVFVPFPFEHFTEISLRLQEYAPFGYVLTLSNANGSYGYLPSMGEIARGGYEIWSGKNSGAYVLTDNADDIIINENLKILRKMKNKE